MATLGYSCPRQSTIVATPRTNEIMVPVMINLMTGYGKQDCIYVQVQEKN